MPKPAEITLLIAAASSGDGSATNQLFDLVYAELRALAGSFFRRQDAGHTLQPTALVHDAYLRLIGNAGSPPQWKDRAHFFAVAAKAMRQILINHARDKRRKKRGGPPGNWERITVSDIEARCPADQHLATHDIDVLALDEALAKLGQLDPRQCQIVELRFFGGLSVEETAKVLDISPRTVKSDWAMARAWLFSQLYPAKNADDSP